MTSKVKEQVISDENNINESTECFHYQSCEYEFFIIVNNVLFSSVTIANFHNWFLLIKLNKFWKLIPMHSRYNFILLTYILVWEHNLGICIYVYLCISLGGHFCPISWSVLPRVSVFDLFFKDTKLGQGVNLDIWTKSIETRIESPLSIGSHRNFLAKYVYELLVKLSGVHFCPALL